MKHFLKNKKRAGLKKGFTLIELMVTIVIFVLLTTVVLFTQGGFNNSILLNNLVYDMSLTIRQTQVYGSGVQESIHTSSFPSYGVYFSPSNLGNDSFMVFSVPDTITAWPYFDISNNNTSFQCTINDLQCIQKYNVKNGFFISQICVGDNETDCKNNILGPANDLYIIFKRPSPNALIYTDAGGNTTKAQNYAKITVSSADGATSSIVVTGLGQIYVQR